MKLRISAVWRKTLIRIDYLSNAKTVYMFEILSQSHQSWYKTIFSEGHRTAINQSITNGFVFASVASAVGNKCVCLVRREIMQVASLPRDDGALLRETIIKSKLDATQNLICKLLKLLCFQLTSLPAFVLNKCSKFRNNGTKLYYLSLHREVEFDARV